MLSMTQTDAPRISFATPEDVKAVSAQTLNIWTGALSPLWLPFWAAATVGVGIWTFGQAVKRGFSALPLEGDTTLLTKWPGFALSLAAPAAKAIEEAAEPDVAKTAAAVEAAPKAAAKTAKKVVEAAEEVVAPVIVPVETVAEAAEPIVAESIAAVEDAQEIAAETTEKVADTITATASAATADAVETTTEAVEIAASETAIDPVVPSVVSKVAEEEAEATLFKPLSAKVAPKHGKKR